MPSGTIARLLIDKGFRVHPRRGRHVEHFFHRSSVRQRSVRAMLREGQRVEFTPEAVGEGAARRRSSPAREASPVGSLSSAGRGLHRSQSRCPSALGRHVSLAHGHAPCSGQCLCLRQPTVSLAPVDFSGGSERGPVALPVFKIGRSPLTRGGWVRLPGASANLRLLQLISKYLVRFG